MRKLHRIAFGRFAEPEDIANAVGFLVQDASEYATGQTLFVDGGGSPGDALSP